MFFFLMAISLNVMAQGKLKVQGVVTDAENGEPLIGVTVKIVGDNKTGVITDLNGEYSIMAKKGDKIAFSYIGMKRKVMTVKSNKMDVVLSSDAVLLDEVVAIGYGTVKKKELTGAAIQVKSDELQNVVSTDVGMALQGLVSGVSVTSSAGDPGSVANIQIRGVTSISGSNTPLFVVDGVPQEGNPNLSSNEIATIDILKDAASCAIYGTRGAAGVILITTKQGQSGKMKVSLDATYGFQEIAYDRLPQVMDTREQTYCEILDGRLDGFSDMEINYMLSKNKYYYMNNTDVMDMILEEGLRPEQSYNLTLSGGTKELTYSVMTGYYKQNGIVMNSGYDRFNMRNNLNYRKNRVKLSLSTSFSMDKTRKASGTSLGQALNFMPYTPYIDREQDEFEVPGVGYSSEVSQVSMLLRAFQTKDETNKNTFSGNFGFDYELFKSFTFTTKVGINLNNTYRENFVPNASVYDSEGTEVSLGSSSSKSMNEATRRFSLSWFGGFNYNTVFNKSHKLSVNALASYEQYDFKGFDAGRYGVMNNDIEVINGASRRPFANSKTFYIDRLLGFIGRVQYSFKEKYLLSFSTRADASSKFAKENRWGFFPSVSGGWNVSDEKFWKKLSGVMNTFKIRASYGTTGNQSFPSYSYISTVKSGIDYPAASGSVNYGSILTTYASPDVKWETSIQTNIGFDMAFMKNMFTLSGDIYRTDKKDMLATVKLPASTGVGTGTNSLVTKNIGNMVNKGIELNLGYRYAKRKFSLKTNVNFSKNVNEITNLGGDGAIMYNSNSMIISGDANSVTTVFAEGYEAGAFFLYKTAGVANTIEKLVEYQKIKPDAKMGDLIFKDMDGDGAITNNDRAYCGSGLPDFEMGWNLNIVYKNFDISTQWFASVGNEIINGAEAMSFDSGRNRVLLYQWSEANTTSNIPAYRGNGKNHMNYIGYSDLWVEDGSFLRMKAITLGYTLPKVLTTRLKLSNIRFFITGQNLITLTRYSGMDPENGGNGLSTRGLDKGGYPISKKYMFGVKLDF